MSWHQYIVVVIILIYILGKEFFIRLYLGNEKSDYVQQLTRRGLEIAPYGFVFLSYNIMIITIYQSLNDSITSSVFTVLENLVMNNLTILILPSFYGIDGIWFAFPLAEFLCFIIMLIFSPKRINIKNV